MNYRYWSILILVLLKAIPVHGIEVDQLRQQLIGSDFFQSAGKFQKHYRFEKDGKCHITTIISLALKENIASSLKTTMIFQKGDWKVEDRALTKKEQVDGNLPLGNASRLVLSMEFAKPIWLKGDLIMPTSNGIFFHSSMPLPARTNTHKQVFQSYVNGAMRNPYPVHRDQFKFALTEWAGRGHVNLANLPNDRFIFHDVKDRDSFKQLIMAGDKSMIFLGRERIGYKFAVAHKSEDEKGNEIVTRTKALLVPNERLYLDLFDKIWADLRIKQIAFFDYLPIGNISLAYLKEVSALGGINAVRMDMQLAAQFEVLTQRAKMELTEYVEICNQHLIEVEKLKDKRFKDDELSPVFHARFRSFRVNETIKHYLKEAESSLQRVKDKETLYKEMK